jgi:hypothetical protein
MSEMPATVARLLHASIVTTLMCPRGDDAKRARRITQVSGQQKKRPVRTR